MKILKEESPKRSEEDQGLLPGANMKDGGLAGIIEDSLCLSAKYLPKFGITAFTARGVED
jgi:hypothetical protein